MSQLRKEVIRRRPYTAAGIRRVKCVRCGEARADQQWNICALPGRFHAICVACDIALNQAVLEFMRFRDIEATMAAYRERMAA